jgi:hypothetical protein
MLLSGLVYALAAFWAFTRYYYGPGLLIKVVGLAPLLARTSIPTLAFVVTGVLVSPSNGRKVPFVFFVLALFFSVGGIEIVKLRQAANPNSMFLSVACVGIFAGALAGMYFGSLIQTQRIKRLQLSTEPA